MLDELTEKKEILENQLIDLEKMFNEKREQYLRILGAIEALEALETQLVDLERIFNEKREQYLKILGAIEALENLDPSVPPVITPHPKE